MTLYLSRMRLRDDPGFARLGPILFPDDPNAKTGVLHRLVWSLFPEELSERPFLYRETATGGGGRSLVYVLSRLLPEDRLGLFDLQTKPFEPQFASGDRLAFSLRANPAVNRREAGKTHRHDVVMAALKDVPAGERAAARPNVIRTAGRRWLEGQGERGGFRLADPNGRLTIDGYDQVAVDRPRPGSSARQPAMRHSALEFEGELEVVDPARFLERLAEGFGRARAFGFGLMLVRRA